MTKSFRTRTADESFLAKARVARHDVGADSIGSTDVFINQALINILNGEIHVLLVLDDLRGSKTLHYVTHKKVLITCTSCRRSSGEIHRPCC